MKKFICNKCENKYVTTDGVRKHARKNHGDWVKFLKPIDYCTPCEPYILNFKDLKKLLYPIKPIKKIDNYEIMNILTLGNDYYKDLPDPTIQNENDPDTWISNLE